MAEVVEEEVHKVDEVIEEKVAEGSVLCPYLRSCRRPVSERIRDTCTPWSH